MDIGCRLMVQLAEGCVRGVTAVTDRSTVEIEAAADNVLDRIEINARDMLAGQGVDPDSEQWSILWAVMERRYRERLAELMVKAGYRSTRPIQ